MQITTQNFFGFIQNHIPSCISNAKNHGWQPSSSCFDPNNYQRISTFFNSFLFKHSQFGNCTTLNDSNKLYKCLSNDGTGAYLLLDTNPSDFGMNILNDQKNTVNESGYRTRWFGYRISCFLSIATEKIYECVCRLPESKRYSYFLSETKKGICDESYFPNPLKGGYVSSDCKSGLPLFDKFLSRSTFEEISLLSRVWSYTKLATGATGTLYFGYKTLIELNNLWKAFEEKSKENEDQLQLEKPNQKTPVIDVVSLEKDTSQDKKSLLSMLNRN